MTHASPPDPNQGVIATLSPALVDRFQQMAMIIPSEDSGGMDRIVEQILGAASWEDVNAPWESSKAEQIAGRILRLESVTRRPSDFQSGLGIFLVVRSHDIRSGEEIVWTTGSVGIVAQLVQMYCLSAFPCFAELIIAERPTEAGFRPHHLKIHGVANVPPPADGEAAAT